MVSPPTSYDPLLHLQVMRAFSSRDRNFLSMLIELIFSVAVNFTAGMVASVFLFVFRLPWLLASYQPSWVRDRSWPNLNSPRRAHTPAVFYNANRSVSFCFDIQRLPTLHVIF